MGIDRPDYVFNLDALLFGGAILVLVMLIHAVLAISIHVGYSKVSGHWMRHKKYLRAQLAFLVAMFCLMIPHLVEIGVWGAARAWVVMRVGHGRPRGEGVGGDGWIWIGCEV